MDDSPNNDLRKTLADVGYVAIGAGVLGFQRLQVRRREIESRLADGAGPLHVIGEQTTGIRLTVKRTLDHATESLYGHLR
mgnify:FL=1